MTITKAMFEEYKGIVDKIELLKSEYARINQIYNKTKISDVPNTNIVEQRETLEEHIANAIWDKYKMQIALYKKIDALPIPSSEIIIRKFLKFETIRQIAEEKQCSCEQIRRICAKAISNKGVKQND